MVITDLNDFEALRMNLAAQPPVGGDVQGHHIVLKISAFLKSVTISNSCDRSQIRGLAQLVQTLS